MPATHLDVVFSLRWTDHIRFYWFPFYARRRGNGIAPHAVDVRNDVIVDRWWRCDHVMVTVRHNRSSIFRPNGHRLPPPACSVNYKRSQNGRRPRLKAVGGSRYGDLDFSGFVQVVENSPETPFLLYILPMLHIKFSLNVPLISMATSVPWCCPPTRSRNLMVFYRKMVRFTVL